MDEMLCKFVILNPSMDVLNHLGLPIDQGWATYYIGIHRSTLNYLIYMLYIFTLGMYVV
jgi:hypothetical protein